MTPAERGLSLAARIPSMLMPFAAALVIAPAGWLPAVAGAAAALGGRALGGVPRSWWRGPRSTGLQLASAILHALSVLLLMTAAAQGEVMVAVALSGVAGLSAPAERRVTGVPALERSAFMVALIIAVVAAVASAPGTALIASAFLAAAAVPVLVILRAPVPPTAAEN